MGWSDSGINWLNPADNTPLWPVFVELAKAINERYFLTNIKYTAAQPYPLISTVESENYPGSTNSSGNRQYKMHLTAKQQYRPFIVPQALDYIVTAIRLELAPIYGRTDITDYTVDENNPRDIKELSVYGFPQIWRNSKPPGYDDLEWIEFNTPLANSVATRIDNNDPSIFTSLGYLKKEIITELFELMKAFKYMYFAGNIRIDGTYTGESRRRNLYNEEESTFNTTWANLSDQILFQNNQIYFYVSSTTGTKKTGQISNTDRHDELGEFGFTSVPNFVTQPRYRIRSQNTGPVPEAIAPGFYNLNTQVINTTTVLIKQWITTDGQTPNSLTLPPYPDDYSSIFSTVTNGSGSTTSLMCYDLTSSTDLDYSADGS